MTQAPSTHDLRAWWRATAGLALVLFPALLATGRGLVAANIDPLLATDPGEQLRRSLSVWDPHVGLGTVTEGDVGLLWPLGPTSWVLDRVGAPDWMAQRLILASILFAAGAGVLYLTRTWRWRPTAGIGAAFLYALSPFVLTASVHRIGPLMAFAGLPWLLALTIRALRTRVWRHPAAFALVVATIGSTDAAALALVLLVPAAWIVYAWMTSEVSGGLAVTTGAKILLLTVAVNVWWIGAATVRATNGIDTRTFGITPDVVADASTAGEVLRGLGNWILYDADGAGPLVGPGRPYTQSIALLVVSLGIPVLGLIGLGIGRWRHRPFVIALLAAGGIIAVGAHPWNAPSPLGAIMKPLATADAGLPLRSLSSAVPIVALAIALGVGTLIGAAAEDVPRRGLVGAAVAVAVAVAGLPALWTGALVDPDRSRPESIPAHWVDLAAHIDDRGPTTRVLEIPGSDTASHLWGAAADSVLASLSDRPGAVRERVPRGSVASADLLAALDDRIQDLTLEPGALAVMARFLGAGDVVVRNDLTTDEYGLVEPSALWDLVREAPGLGTPEVFGSVAADGGPTIPAVAAFPVENPQPIVRTRAATHAVILSGDGGGLVDAASAGLLRGSELVRYSASLTADPEFLVDQLVDDRTLIVTDTNRARSHQWSTVRGSRGHTEQADGGALREDLADRRLSLFDARPGTRSVAVHDGVQARATSYGSAKRYDPEFRPFRATDDDLATAWVVGIDASADAPGERLALSVPAGVTTDRINLLQAPGRRDRIGAVDLRFDDGPAMRAELGTASLSSSGQIIEIDERTFEQLSIEIVSVVDGGGTGDSPGVGLADVDVGVDARELIRMPQDLLDAGGFRTLRYPLALVQTRQRTVGDDPAMPDEEESIARIVELPTARRYRIAGTARLSSRGPDGAIDVAAEAIDTGCRDDLLTLDGVAVPLRITGSTAAAIAGQALAIQSCDDAPVSLLGGDHEMIATPGESTGIDIDQLVWCSAAQGEPCAGDASLSPSTPDGPIVEVVSSEGATVEVSITDADPGEPFWLVVGQSHDRGWEILSDDVDSTALVDGAMNGFLVTAPEEEFELTARFTPQNRVEIGMLLSVIGVLVALGLVAARTPPPPPFPIPLQEPIRRIRGLSWEGALPTRRDAIGVGLAAALVSGFLIAPLIGFAIGVMAGWATRREGWRPLFTVLPAAFLAISAFTVLATQARDRTPHGLDWVAEASATHQLALSGIVLLAIDVVIDLVWVRRSDFR